jgi:hypothetical protein
LIELLAGIDESKIALEATYGWEWLAELLGEHGYEFTSSGMRVTMLAPGCRTEGKGPV